MIYGDIHIYYNNNNNHNNNNIYIYIHVCVCMYLFIHGDRYVYVPHVCAYNLDRHESKHQNRRRDHELPAKMRDFLDIKLSYGTYWNTMGLY